jgi:Lon-like ATP-dependent protease
VTDVIESTAVSDPIVVDAGAELIEYVGQPPFQTDRIYDQTPPGVVTGLAWTSMGGSTLYIECTAIHQNGEDNKKGGSLTTTGQLGDVMKESASIAHTFARSFLAKRFPGNTFFDDKALHIHVPAGATPKDGPSAGCTMITGMVSLATDRPVKPNLAMTGEVTLTGIVMPIGGVKEKTIAARRSGVTTILFPEGNRKDWDELSDDIKEGLEVHFVSTYDEVYKHALSAE